MATPATSSASLTVGLPLFNSAQGDWTCHVGPLRFSNQSQASKNNEHLTNNDYEDDTAGSIWGAAMAFAKYVQNHKNNTTTLFSGSIVELGSGTGIGGLSIAVTGAATSVVLTDLPSNLHILEAAVRDNQVAVPQTTKVAVAALQWGSGTDGTEATEEARGKEETEETEETRETGGMGETDASEDSKEHNTTKYDVVVAIDCIYCHTLHSLLAATAVRLCKQEGRILIVNELRWQDNDKWWKETAEQEGLVLTSTVELPSPPQIPRKVLMREYRIRGCP